MRKVTHAVVPVMLMLSGCTERSDTPIATATSLQIVLEDTLPLGFTSLPTLGWQDDSTLIVIDRYETQVVAVRASGEVWRVGREGAGVGEFRVPGDVRVGPNGSVAVADVGNMRVTALGQDGTVDRSVLLPQLPIRMLAHWPDSLLMILAQPGTARGPLLGTVSWETGSFNHWFDVFERIPDLAVTTPGIPTPSPYVIGATRTDGTVVLGVGARYVFVETGPNGKVVGQIGRPELAAELPTPSDSVRFFQAINTTRSALSERPTVAAAIMAPMLARYMRMPKPFFSVPPAIDPAGRLWVLANRSRNDSTSVDVFSREGHYISEVMVEGRALGIAAHGTRVAILISGAEEGLLDVIRIYGTSQRVAQAN